MRKPMEIDKDEALEARHADELQSLADKQKGELDDMAAKQFPWMMGTKP